MTHRLEGIRILFLNQVAGPLFRELAEDLAQAVGSCVLITGKAECSGNERVRNLHLLEAPSYRRDSHFIRLKTWCSYFLFTFHKVWVHPPTTLLFIASNPPFLPLIGFLMQRFRGQPYVVVVYDIYPDLLVGLGRLSERNPITWIWRGFNRRMLEKAEVVFTIGDVMAANLERTFDAKKTPAGRVVVVPNWASADFIKPLPKKDNWFAQKYDQVETLTVLYSGNFGATHDIESLLYAAKEFQEEKDVQFLLIGEGTKWPWVQKIVAEEDLKNVKLLPIQPEEVLPYSLTTGDVAVVTLERGVEGLSVPSKTFYALAAGSALLVVAAGDNEVTRLVVSNECGLTVEPGDVGGIVKALEKFRSDPDFLDACRKRSRRLMEKSYSRKNTQLYVDTLARLGVPSP